MDLESLILSGDKTKVEEFYRKSNKEDKHRLLSLCIKNKKWELYKIITHQK